MSGNGARPKSQPPQRKNEEKADTTRRNETSDEFQWQDISRLFRDNERMKNRLSALQSQLEAQLGSEHKGSNLSLSHPPTMQQPDQIFMSSENKENPVRNSEKEKNPIRRDTMLNNRRNVEGSGRSPNQQLRQSITSNQLSQQNSQEAPDGPGFQITSNGDTVLAQQNQRQLQAVLPNHHHQPREHQQSRRGEQPSRNDVQLSRREVELLYSEMRKLQDEIEQHRSRFQENSQPSLQDFESESEDLGSITNLNISRQRRDNGDVNISSSQSFTEPRTSRTSTTHRQTRSTSYLLGPDLLSVETENCNPSDTDEDMTENNLALLTAQYEKTQDEELYVPPAMSLLNNWNQQQSCSSSSIPNQLRSPAATSSVTNQLRSPPSNTNQLHSSSTVSLSNQPVSSAFASSNQNSQANISTTQLGQANSSANHLVQANSGTTQLSQATNPIQTTSGGTITQPNHASRAANQLTMASRVANLLAMTSRASNQLNSDVSLQSVPRQSHLDSSQRLVNPTYSTDEIRSMGLSNQYRNQTAAPKRSARNQNELERQIKEQRDELARLIQKARSSPNMNEWRQEQAKTSDNKNTQSHVNKIKNLKRGSVSSVNIPPSGENSDTVYTVNGSREEDDHVSIVSEELSGTADNSFDTPADINEYRHSADQQMERLRNIQNELDRLADQMERLSSSDLNAGSCLFPRTLARNVPQEFDININTQANLNNEAAARLNYNAARSSRLTDRTVNGLNSVASSRLLYSNRSDRPTNNMQGDIIPAEFQMQQLAISVNQIHQVFWDLRRDLTRVIDRVSALEVQMTAHDRIATLESQLAGSGSHLGVPDCFGMTAAASRSFVNDIFENNRNLGINGRASGGLNLPPTDPYFDLPLYSLASRNHSEQLPNHRSEPVDDLLSRFLADPAHQYPIQQSPTPPDSGVSSGALNNQVSPGMRANNYYDNFRSFSRQNRLDSLNPSPPDPANRPSQPHSAKLNEDQLEINSLQHGVNLRLVSPGTPPANNAPSSYVKTRKKHKINREQNRNSLAKNSTNLSRDAQHYARAQNIAQTESQSDASTQLSQGRRVADTNTQEPHGADISPNNRYSARASQGVDANYGVSDLASNEASDVASNEVVATSRNREVINSNAANANAEGNIAAVLVQEHLRSFVADNLESQAVTRNNLGTPANTSNNAVTRNNDDGSVLGLSGETSNVVPTNFQRTDNSYVEDISDNIYSQIESLITNHESSPEFLASLLEDLTILSTARGHFDSPNRSHSHERNSRQSSNNKTKTKKQNPATNNFKYNHNLSDSSTDDNDIDQTSANRRMAGNRFNNRVSANAASASSREAIRNQSLTSSASHGGSYSTPAHHQMGTPLQNPLCAASSIASLESTPLTQQYRNNNCNVITPNPSYPPNNASTPNTGDTNNLTPRIIPNLSRREDSLTSQADSRTRSQIKQVAVVAAQFNKSSCSPVQGCSPVQQNLGQQQNLGVVEPLSSISNNTVLVEPRRQQRSHHLPQPEQSQHRPHKDSMQLHRLRTHHPNHLHRNPQEQNHEANDPRLNLGQQEDNAVSNREILSGYSVPKNQQRRNVVRGEQRKLTPHNRQDEQPRQELSRPILYQESRAQEDARLVFPQEASRVELSRREITRNDLSSPVPLSRQGLPTNIQSASPHLDNQGFLTVQLQEPSRQSNSVRNELYLRDDQLSNISQSTRKREAVVDSVDQQGAVAQVDDNNLEQVGITESQNISLAEGDGDGVADLAEADQAHTEEQDPVAAAALPERRKARDGRGEQGASSIRQNVITSNQVRNSTLFQNQSRKAERGVRNDNVHNFSQLKCSPGAGNAAHSISSSNRKPSNEEKYDRAMQPVQQISASPLNLHQNFDRECTESSQQQFHVEEQPVPQHHIEDHDDHDEYNSVVRNNNEHVYNTSAINAFYDNNVMNDDHDEYNRGTTNADRDEYNRGVINDDHDEYTRGAIKEDDHDEYNRAVRSSNYDEYSRGAMNANRDTDHDEFENERFNDEHELLDTEGEEGKELVEERENELEMMNGLDRVPIRLQSNQAEYVESLRLEEEISNQAALLQDVLASSPELANTGLADTPNSP